MGATVPARESMEAKGKLEVEKAAAPNALKRESGLSHVLAKGSV
jgi:hypothetical protein